MIVICRILCLVFVLSSSFAIATFAEGIEADTTNGGAPDGGGDEGTPGVSGENRNSPPAAPPFESHGLDTENGGTGQGGRDEGGMSSGGEYIDYSVLAGPASQIACYNSSVGSDSLKSYGLSSVCKNSDGVIIDCLTKLPLEPGESQPDYVWSIWFNSAGTAFFSEEACVLSNQISWFFGSTGLIAAIPSIAAMIVFFSGVLYFLAGLFSSGNSSNSIKDHDIRKLEERQNIDLSWLKVLHVSVDNLNRDSNFLVKRARILNGSALSLISVALASMVLLGANFKLESIENFGAAFVVVAPITLLFLASGYVLRISLGVSSEIASLRTEKTKSEVLLSRGLARIVSSLDLDGMFEGQKRILDPTKETEDAKMDSKDQEPDVDMKSLARLLGLALKGT